MVTTTGGVASNEPTTRVVFRQVPIGVGVPRSVEDVESAVEVCRRHRVPVLPRGCGTSLAGQCCNVAVVIDFSKYLNRIIELDPDRRVARVEPGESSFRGSSGSFVPEVIANVGARAARRAERTFRLNERSDPPQPPNPDR